MVCQKKTQVLLFLRHFLEKNFLPFLRKTLSGGGGGGIRGIHLSDTRKIVKVPFVFGHLLKNVSLMVLREN